MAEVLCDTDFLIRLATTKIKNLDNLGVEIGDLEFVVPQVVINELERLKKDEKKKPLITTTLGFIQNLKTIPIDGMFADSKLISHVRTHRGMVATMDRKLKKQIKKNGGSVISLFADRIVLES